MKLIKAIRPVNLLMAVLILYSVLYGILEVHTESQIRSIISELYFFSLISIMVFGYLINDYFDVETDRINKPGKNIFEANKNLKSLSILGLLAILGISVPIFGFLYDYRYANLLIVYAFAFAMLIIYARFLKNSIFIGNILIAVLASLTFSVPYLLYVDESNASNNLEIVEVSIYCVFAFLITLVREIVKDVEDMEGDKMAGIKTIATVAGSKTSVYFSTVIMTISIILLGATSYYFFNLNVNYTNAIAFLVLAICGLFPFFKIIRATDKKHFSQSSIILKVWMLLGILSMWI